MIVYWQHGYLIDWNWAAELAVWTTSSDRAEQLVAAHRLDRVPRSGRDAVAVAEQWWHRTGRAGIAAARDRAGKPEVVAL